MRSALAAKNLTDNHKHVNSIMDTVSTHTRSIIMSRIKQRDSKLELRLRKELWKHGVRYRKNVRIYGTPDLMIKKLKILVFVDSCFWHGCPFHCRRPKSNTAFWDAKITRNRARDRKVSRYYRTRGYVVLRFWEHKIQANLPACVEKILLTIDKR